MKITVGFITSGKNKKLFECIDTVFENVPNAEIVVVGGENEYPNSIKHIYFNENIKTGWITRKKNIITHNSSGEIIVYCHDYFMFMDGWLDSWNQFGWNWDYACNRIELINGTRDYDHISWDHPKIKQYSLIPYEMNTEEDFLGTYISGGYMLAKKHFMLTYPFNENLTWGMAEDVEWSLRVRGKGKQSFNKDAVVRHNKEHLRYINMIKFAETELPIQRI
jgi:hypothetical protein